MANQKSIRKRWSPKIRVDWNFITAFAAGAVAGAVTALLYAPSDGETLRAGIADKATGSIEGASKKIEALTDMYGSTYRTGRFQVERLFAAVSAGMDEGRRVRTEAQRVLSGESEK